MIHFKGFLYVVGCLCLIATASCGGAEFDVWGNTDAPDAKTDVVADAKPEADAGKPDAKPEADAAHQDAKPEVEAALPEASPEVQPEAATETGPEAGEDVQAEAEVEAGEDAAEEPEAALPDAPPDAADEPDVQVPDVQVADVATEDGPPLTLCQQYGTDGAISVVVKVGNQPPSGKVLALYGTVKHTVADAGANLPYGVWKFGQSGETQIIALPIAELHNLELLFAWGFTGPGNTNFNSWDMRCTATGCNVNDMASVCAGKQFLGSFDHGQFKPGVGTCTAKLNGSMTVTEVDCIIN